MEPFRTRIHATGALGICLAMLMLVAWTGCGTEDDDDFFNSARVVDLAVQDSSIRAGEGTVLAVNFSFDSSNLFQDHDNVVVVIRLPAGIEYRDGTAEIDSLGGDDGIGAQVVGCSDSGESYLVFDMDEFDLDDATNPSGEGDAILKLTIDGIDPIGFTTIEAAADDDRAPLFSCGGSFASDEEISISVD